MLSRIVHHQRCLRAKQCMSSRHLARHLFGGGPGGGKRKLCGPFNPIARSALNAVDLFVGDNLFSLENTYEASNRVFLLPFCELRQLAVLRRIAFVMAAQAVSQPLDKARTFAAARPLYRL